MSRRIDRLALAIASKRSYFCLIRSLYSHARVNIAERSHGFDSSNIEYMARLDCNGMPQNPGLKHIRHLEFVARGHVYEQQASKIARTIVRALSTTPLELFSWPSQVPIDADILWDLWTPLAQSIETKLSSLYLPEEIWSEQNVKGTKDALVRFLRAAAQNIEHVDIIARTHVGLENISTLLRKMDQHRVRLSSFSLDLSAFDPPMGSGAVNWDGTVQEPISESLFTHLLPLRPLRPAPYESIAKIVLKSVNLCQAEKTFCLVFSFKWLEHLELLRCPFAGRFLNAVSKAASNCLCTLKLDHDVDDAAQCPGSESEDPEEVSASLRWALKIFEACLGTLHIRLKGHAPLALPYDALHCTNLKSIYLDTAHEASTRGRSTREARDAIIEESDLLIGRLIDHCDFICDDVAVATAGRAWANRQQFDHALLGGSYFQYGILGSVSPKILTMIMSRGALSLLYDNPAQRLKQTTTYVPHIDLERVYATMIAMCTFQRAEGVASDLEPHKFHPDLQLEGFRRMSVPGEHFASTLQAVIIAVEPDEVSTPTVTNSIGRGSRPREMSYSTKQDMGERREYAFVRGQETVVINGLQAKRDSIVQVSSRDLANMGMDVPRYFET